MEEPRDHRKAVVTFLAVVIIAIVVVAAVAASPKKKAADTAPTQPVSSTASTAASTNSSTSFKDGSYTATGSYESPGGTENITVHLTLKGGVIAATSADSGAQDPDASSYQQVFISKYKSLVVGKKIADVNLSRVSGSSLTSQGFNDAIQQIENQAKA
jgi:uncharacterized protein with FMN-binding domain